MEALGRVNYGPLLGEHKGILGGVQVDRRLVHSWDHLAPLDRWGVHASTASHAPTSRPRHPTTHVEVHPDPDFGPSEEYVESLPTGVDDAVRAE